MKFMLRVVAVVIGIFLAACTAAIFLVPAEAQSVTRKKYTATYMFEPGNVPGPDVRIYVLVDADNEGDAAIKSYRCLAEKLTIGATEKLKFLEAQQRQ